ncbi:hypothetical protein AVEN_71454-1 [Araneus ventricosus]|uniref:Histone-lysine N-methyltransferase SETMAR n=1 Tax=Araneus ventricosus TaxID=182803 RepID=A0A4Y2CWA8_ARAVE|nr:hypothetical protein AVEN_71454-1 [Araneus ventricosus]
MVIAGTLLHDHARPHMELRIQQLLQRFRWELFDHPAYSPYLATSDYHLLQHLKRFLAKQHFSSDDDVQTDGSALRQRISLTQVCRNWSHGMTRASIPVVLMLRGS